jgi:hypothetical protein
MFTSLERKKYAIYLLSQFNLLNAPLEGSSVYYSLLRYIDKGTNDEDSDQQLKTLRNDIVSIGRKKNPAYLIQTFIEYKKSLKRDYKPAV